jgi:hypothetical protein
MRIRRTAWATTLSGVALLALTACGTAGQGNKVASVSGGGTTSSTAGKGTGNAEDQRLAYVKCMADKGVELPGSKGGGQQNADASMVESPEFKKAFEGCKQLLPNGGEVRPPSAQELDEAKNLANCMRGQGIEVTGPDGEGRMDFNGEPGDPKIEAAYTKCGGGGSKPAGGGR